MAGSRSITARRTVVLLIGLLLVARLVGMAALPLMDTTEARYGDIARRMAELGDWVTPWHDDGVPFWGKPPLSFWLTAASFRLFGVGEFAARLPHFLCAVLVAALVWQLARRRGRGEATWAVAVLAGSAAFFVGAGAVMTDGALVLGTTLAMTGFWLALDGATPAERRRSGWLFFAGIAIGVLAKGPLALVLAAAPTLAWTALERRWADVRRGLPWLGGLLLVLLVGVPWFVLAELRTPGFLAYFIVGEHWHRFVTPGWKGDLYGQAHRFTPGTIWLFGLASLLPWSLVLPLAEARERAAAPVAGEREWRRYLLSWALTPLVFFTAARNILWTYALPALPAAALLIAAWLARRPRHADAWCAVGTSVSLLAALVATVAGVASGTVERATAKSVVQAYTEHASPTQPLAFVGSRPFSASFYSGGRARALRTPEQLRSLAEPVGAYVAVPVADVAFVRDAGVVVVQRLGRFGAFELLQLQPGSHHDDAMVPLHVAP